MWSAPKLLRRRVGSCRVSARSQRDLAHPRAVRRECPARGPSVAHTAPVAGATRRQALLGAAGSCVVALAGADRSASTGSAHTTTWATRAAVDPTAFHRVATREPLVGLTFDDGPDPDYTPAVLDVLARFGARATFFTIGRNIELHPGLARRALAEGHELANHTADHLWLDALGPRAVAEQLLGGGRALSGVGGTGRWFRPPRGWTSPTVAASAGDLRLRSVYWTVCVEAHGTATRAATAEHLATGALPGTIVLAHDGGTVTGPNAQHVDRSFTLDTLPLLLRALERRGLRAVSVSRLARGGPGE